MWTIQRASPPSTSDPFSMSPLLFFDFGVITPSVSFLQLFCEINDVLEDLFISLGSFFTQDCFGWLKVLVRSGWARQKQMGVAEGGGGGGHGRRGRG